MHSSVDVRLIACPKEHTYEREIMAAIDGPDSTCTRYAGIERLRDAICESDPGRTFSVQKPRSSCVWLGCGKLLTRKPRRLPDRRPIGATVGGVRSGRASQGRAGHRQRND